MGLEKEWVTFTRGLATPGSIAKLSGNAPVLQTGKLRLSEATGQAQDPRHLEDELERCLAEAFGLGFLTAAVLPLGRGLLVTGAAAVGRG